MDGIAIRLSNLSVVSLVQLSSRAMSCACALIILPGNGFLHHTMLAKVVVQVGYGRVGKGS